VLHLVGGFAPCFGEYGEHFLPGLVGGVALVLL
jgi:hypothetical protein